MARRPDNPPSVDVSWRRSTYCASTTCLEVADLGEDVAVRNSRVPDVILFLAREEWAAFVAGVKRDEIA